MMVLLLSALLSLPSFTSAETVAERFLREYPAAAERLDAMTRFATGRGEIESRNYDGKEMRAEISLARRPGYYLYIRKRHQIVSGTNLEPTLVMCQTPTQWFRLTRDASTQPYSLDALTKGTYRTFDEEESSHVGKFLDLGRIESIKISDLIKKQGFRITAAEEVDREGGRVVEVRFTLTDEKLPLREGRLVFDPRADWALVAYEIVPVTEKGEQIHLTRTMEYRRGDDGTIVPTKVTLLDTVDFDGKKRLDSTVVTFKEVSYSTPAEREFSLPAFNVPEIALRPEPRSSFFSLRNPILWAGLAVSVAAFVALAVLRKRSSRG